MGWGSAPLDPAAVSKLGIIHFEAAFLHTPEHTREKAATYM
jgi:hypothetical protein